MLRYARKLGPKRRRDPSHTNNNNTSPVLTLISSMYVVDMRRIKYLHPYGFPS